MDPEPGSSAHDIKAGGMGLPTAGLICGLVGQLVFAPILGTLAIIFGGIGLAAASKNAIGAGKSLSIASLVAGIICVVRFALAIAMYAAR